MILLAQQLIGAYGHGKKSTNDSAAFASSSSSDIDVRYHTDPEGVKPLAMSSLALTSPSNDDISEISSMASEGREDTDDERLTDMFRSHSDLINEIDVCALRLKGILLEKGVNDYERESASGESSAGC